MSNISNNTETLKKMRDFGIAKYRETQRIYRENGLRGETESCRRVMRSVVPQVGEALCKELEFYSHRRNNPPLFLMFIMDFDGYELGHITLKCLMDMMDSLPKMQEVAVNVGSAVEAVARRRYFEEHRGEWDKYLLKKKQRVLKGNRRSQMEVFFEEEEKHEMFGDFIRFRLWTPRHKATLGMWLFEQVRMHSGLFELFYHKSRVGHSTKHVRPSKNFNDWLNRFDKWRELMRPHYLATPDVPAKWEGNNVGGYKHDGEMNLTFVKYRGDVGDMHKIFNSVNNIQSVKWQINKQVLDVATKSWTEGLLLGGMPHNEEVQIEDYYDGDCPVELSDWKTRKRRAIEANLKTRGARFRTAKTMYTANYYFKNLTDGFYFPHNVDYRGRVYPLPSFVNPQSDDLGRSLLLFAKGEQIVDEEDFEWILIAGANAFGAKGTFEERVAWAKSRESCILASADDPIGEQWWTEASDPWNMLAFCFEYKKWKDEGYGYTSYFPVHQDASNNGIQLMSMLLRDEESARQVNLCADAPLGDMYQQVADNVTEILKKDRSKDALAAGWYRFGVNRKFAKPIVMARPYGARCYNSVDVLMPVYEDMVEKSYRPFEKGENLTAIGYLAKLINKEVDKLLPKHMALMGWLKDLYKDGALEWTTPYGYSVKSVIYRYKKVEFMTAVNGLLDKCYIKKEEGVDKKRIRRAFIANYIHSLDASVVHKVADQMEFDMGFVHDSFCSHAPNVKAMKRLLLKTYNEYFSRDLLDELSKEVAITQDTEVHSRPQLGTYDVSQIHRCSYVFH